MDIRPLSSIIEVMERTTHALTVREVAQFFMVSEMTIYRLAKAGSIPSFRVGNSLRFDPRTLASWLRHQMCALSPAQFSQIPR